jgi:hypothetical protein
MHPPWFTSRLALNRIVHITSNEIAKSAEGSDLAQFMAPSPHLPDWIHKKQKKNYSNKCVGIELGTFGI